MDSSFYNHWHVFYFTCLLYCYCCMSMPSRVCMIWNWRLGMRLLQETVTHPLSVSNGIAQYTFPICWLLVSHQPPASIFLGITLLTLGACTRGTVVSLCVCVCIFVCYRANCYIHHFKVQGEVSWGSSWCFKHRCQKYADIPEKIFHNSFN